MCKAQEVDPKLGTWSDVEGLADKVDLELELMVNHVSPASTEFQDFLREGDASEYVDMFIDWDRFWPNGEVPAVQNALHSVPRTWSLTVQQQRGTATALTMRHFFLAFFTSNFSHVCGPQKRLTKISWVSLEWQSLRQTAGIPNPKP